MRRVVASGAAIWSLAACAGAASAPTAQPSALRTLPSSPVVGQLLQAAWQSYVRAFIKVDGRVVDPSSGDDTTSEAQSYAMLRAVWMDDRTTFDLVWTWTQQHLWQPSQRIAYLWSGSGAVLDSNSATDADQDIALALIFAGHRWHDSSYTTWSRRVLDGVWSNDVTTVDNVPYVVAGNWAAQGDPAGPVLNPSYFAPYAYRVFAASDSAHDWASLVGSSYRALSACSTAPLRTGRSAGLPPNWCVLDRASGRMRSFAGKSDGDDYGYDAFRVMWRIALDALWFRAAPAVAYLATQTFLRAQWKAHGSLAPVYSHAGTAQASYDDPTVYGGDIGAFLADPAAAQAQLRQKLLASAKERGGATLFGDPGNYYAQNWVWFGIALVTGRLPNLAAGT